MTFILRPHSMLVHVPLALLFGSVLFDVGGAWLKLNSFRERVL